MRKIKIGNFLIERKTRLKPNEANNLGLQRIEKIDFNGNIYLAENTSTRTDMILVKQNDLVISGINVQKGALSVYAEHKDALATIHYSSYIYDEKIIDLEYLKWLLRSKKFSHILEEQTGSGIKTELKPKKFLALEINLPSLEKQKQIVTQLNCRQKKCELLQNIIVKQTDLLNQLKLSILQDAITSNQLLHNYTNISDLEPYALPNGWKWQKLKDLVNSRGISYGIVQLGKDTPVDGVPVLRCSDVKFRNINLSNVRTVPQHVSNKYKRTILQGGEILINIRGTLGGCAIVPENLKGYNIAREVAIIPLDNSLVNPQYVLTVLTSPYIQNLFNSKLRGIAYKGLNLHILSEFLIPIPPLHEQIQIVNRVERLLKEYFQLSNNIDLIKLNANKLLQSALNEYIC